jgi:hypothetical protein
VRSSWRWAVTGGEPRSHSTGSSGSWVPAQIPCTGSRSKLGRGEESRHHLAQAQAAAGDLPADGYGSLVRSEIEALRRRLDAPEQSSRTWPATS